MSIRHLGTVLAILLAQAGAWAANQPSTSPAGVQTPRQWAVADRLGCTHVAGRYSFTQNDFLNEGADRILSLGLRVIKIYLHGPETHYPYNSRWPKFETLVQMASHPYYRDLFKKPFTAYVMTVYAIKPGGGSINWHDGVSDDEAQEEEKQMHALTRYFLQTYRGTGKTFVLQHWEGDWAVRGSTSRKEEDDPSDAAIESMIRWLNARQAGVERARKDVRDSDVKVYHACEVNLVDIAMKGRRTVTNNVLPKTSCDLYSYSAYDTIGVASQDPTEGRNLFRKAMDYIASKAPDSPAFGDKNVYVGEFGWPCVQSEKDPKASDEKSLRVIRMTVEESLAWGCPYVIYWQVYDNESRAGKERPTNEQVRGFYLIRPDDSLGPAWHYFASVLGNPAVSPQGSAPIQSRPPGR